MKYNLFALLWALLIVPVCAQKTLPPGIQPNLDHLPNKVFKSLQAAGFEMDGLAADYAAQYRSSPLQLDSTKTFFGYNLNEPGDSMPLFRTIFKYPAPDTKVETNYQFESGAWMKLDRTTSTSDALGRVVKVEAETYDPDAQGFQPDSRIEIYPHGNSQVLLDSFFVFQWDVDQLAWIQIYFTTNAYDANDQLQVSISSFDYLGQPLLFKDVYKYDANGDNTLIQSFVLIGGAEAPSGKRELLYQNHLPTQVVSFIDDGAGGYFPQDKITYTYTNFDKESQVNTYAFDPAANDWLKTQVDDYSYDNEHRVIAKESVLYNQDSGETHERYTYAYVEDDKFALETTYLWDGTAFYLGDRKYYYYSGGVLASPEPSAQALPLLVSPNPTTGVAQLKLDADALLYIYNAQGAKISNVVYRPGNTLQLHDLPTGLYFVTARVGKSVYTGSVVKE